ncbi:MAG: hypothetical protein V4604_03970 [Bacteroidota bacterium]
MKLKKGIVGGWNVKEELVKSSSNVSQFKNSLYPIEYSGTRSYKVIGFKDDIGVQNYYRLSILDKSENSTLDILINSMYPYYCGVVADSYNEFIHLPAEIISFADSTFSYLSPLELNSRFHESDLTELNESELKEIKYWGAKTFGEIIFNDWD